MVFSKPSLLKTVLSSAEVVIDVEFRAALFEGGTCVAFTVRFTTLSFDSRTVSAIVLSNGISLSCVEMFSVRA